MSQVVKSDTEHKTTHEAWAQKMQKAKKVKELVAWIKPGSRTDNGTEERIRYSRLNNNGVCMCIEICLSLSFSTSELYTSRLTN